MTADFSGLVGKVFTAAQVSKGTVSAPTPANGRIIYTETLPIAQQGVVGTAYPYGDDATFTVTSVFLAGSFTTITFSLKGSNLFFNTNPQTPQGTVLANDATDFVLNAQQLPGLGSAFLLFTNVPADQPGAGNALQVTGSAGNVVYTPPCFCSGTRIATAQGEVAVEKLAVGDVVVTRRHAGIATRRVVWLGHRDVDCTRHPEPHRVWPIRIAADAFGAGQPHQDLYVSPEHAIYAEGVLIPAQELVNGHSVTQQRRDHVTYWHVELDAHDVLLADGLPAESYLENGNREDFVESDVTTLHPFFAGSGRSPDACAVVTRQGPEIEAVRQMLDQRRDARASRVRKRQANAT